MQPNLAFFEIIFSKKKFFYVSPNFAKNMGEKEIEITLRNDPENTWKERIIFDNRKYHVIRVKILRRMRYSTHEIECKKSNECFFCVGCFYERPLSEIYEIRHQYMDDKKSIFWNWKMGLNAWGKPILRNNLQNK